MKPSFYMIIVSFLILLNIAIAGTNAEALPMDEKILNYTLGNYCLDKSYKSAIGKTKQEITQVRAEDLNYASCFDLTCCCSAGIISLFSEKTEDMTHERVNPAVDKLIESLRNQRMASDDKIKELVYLKYINTLYSFFDEDRKQMNSETYTMPDEDGCINTVTFRKLKDEDLNRKGVYREGLLKETLALLHAWKKSVDMIAQKNMIKMVK